MIALYHQTKTTIDFWCRQGLLHVCVYCYHVATTYCYKVSRSRKKIVKLVMLKDLIG